MNKAFTLVEVAVAGSLIGFCVLTAVAIIPRGLQVQNEGRMRAAASAAMMTLSAQAQGYSTGKSCMDPSLVEIFLTADAALSPALPTPRSPKDPPTPRPTPTVDSTTGLTLPPANVKLSYFYNSALFYTYGINLPSDLRYESTETVEFAPTQLWRIKPIPAVGALERRLLFSYTDRNNGASTPQNTRTITVWLLSTDPITGKAPMSARYLATFNEYRP
jgi:hypothetical protein